MPVSLLVPRPNPIYKFNPKFHFEPLFFGLLFVSVECLEDFVSQDEQSHRDEEEGSCGEDQAVENRG